MKKGLVLIAVFTFVLFAQVRTNRTTTTEKPVANDNVQTENKLEFYPTMGYQGLLKDNEGKLVTDGTYKVSFKIYDSETSETAIWKEIQDVEISNGIISCHIGAAEKLNLPFDKQYWLSVSVGDDELPRMILSGTPYSLHARRIAEDAIVGGKNISVSKGEDGKIVLSGEASEKDVNGQIFNLKDGDATSICMDGDANEANLSTDNCTASNYGVALGYGTTANGGGSFASGLQTTASGLHSFACGYLSTANGLRSFSAGHNTIAYSDYSTAFGYSTLANGLKATAFGDQTIASGESSAAIGGGTKAEGKYSFAGGHFSIAHGQSSFAVGHRSLANGLISVALGAGSIAEGDSSFAAGSHTTASGKASIALGDSTIANGFASTAMGYGTTASGKFSTALGDSTKAEGYASTAMGNNTTASGKNSFVAGNDITASGDNCYAFGKEMDSENLADCFMVGFTQYSTPHTKKMSQLFVNWKAVCIGFTNDEISEHLGSNLLIPTYSLLVRSYIFAQGLHLSTEVWPDYVFKGDYNLKPLSEVEQHIKEKGHLPGIVTESEAVSNGVNVGDMQVKLLEKIEELTLYIIEQDKRIKELENVK